MTIAFMLKCGIKRMFETIFSGRLEVRLVKVCPGTFYVYSPIFLKGPLVEKTTAQLAQPGFGRDSMYKHTLREERKKERTAHSLLGRCCTDDFSGQGVRR